MVKVARGAPRSTALCQLLLLGCLVLAAAAGSPKNMIDTSRPIDLADIYKCARAYYTSADQHESHFGQLKIVTDSQCSDHDQAFSAGYLEAKLSAEYIYYHFNNMLCRVNCSGYIDPRVQQFFYDQADWQKEMIRRNPSSDYWQMLDTVLAQFEGLSYGYNDSDFSRSNSSHQLGKWAFIYINGISDIGDVVKHVLPSTRLDYESMSVEELREQYEYYGECSSFFKVTDNMSDIFASQTTWTYYSNMNRIYKHYEFNLWNPSLVAKKMAFSGQPGILFSKDDFYMLDSGLAVTETTNSILNNSLYDLVTEKSLLSWHRIRLANFMAKTGQDWYEILMQYNSGTYNNQYMILNYNLFKPYNALQPGTLWIVEQIPGLILGEDVTNHLQRGYWPSYNIPYLQTIYTYSGYPLTDRKNNHSIFTEYHQSPRAKIFRRDHHKVQDVEAMKKIMRYNDYQHDPFSEGDPSKQICARRDISTATIQGRAFGCIDSKVTSYPLFQEMKAWVVSGPTNDNQPSFDWSKTSFTDLRMGQPDLYNFTFELMGLNNVDVNQI